jgi:hypothetical protein
MPLPDTYPHQTTARVTGLKGTEGEDVSTQKSNFVFPKIDLPWRRPGKAGGWR